MTKTKTKTRKISNIISPLDYRFYSRVHNQQKKPFAYRVPIGDYNYLQCTYPVHEFNIHLSSLWFTSLFHFLSTLPLQ